MSIKRCEILDGITRDEAHGCVFVNVANRAHAIFAPKNEYFDSLGILGLYVDLGPEHAQAKRWHRAIDLYYDAVEAESNPKWVEPAESAQQGAGCFVSRYYAVDGRSVARQIEIDNARRRIEAFIAANGKAGRFGFNTLFGKPVITEASGVLVGVPQIGAITCATRELAEAVLERYPDELRLLCGVK